MKPVWLFVLLLLLAGCGKTEKKADEAKPEETVASVSVATAEKKDIEETVAAQGVVQPAQGAMTKLSPQIAGRLVRVLVKEGERVSAGQVVATLDTRTLVAQSRSAEAGYQASRASAAQAVKAMQAAASDQRSGVHTARLALESARAERDGSVQAAQTARKLAQAELARTLAGARPQEVVQAKDALRQAEATRDRARIEAERQQFLFEKGISAKRQADDAQTALTVAEASVESAKQALELTLAGARKEDRDAARLRVRQADESLVQAQKTGNAKVAQAQAALSQAESQTLAVAAKVQEAEAARSSALKASADVSVAQVQAEYAALRAPISGVVTKRWLSPGDMADPAGAVLEIADNRQLELLASLPESDAERVQPGQRARLAAGQTGTVVSVGAVDPQTALVPVRIRVSQSASLRAGALQSVKIVVRVARGATVIPKEALLTREGKSVVFVATGESAKETPVTLGAETEAGVEVRSGLSAGAKVITVGGYELTDGAKIKVEKP